MKRNAALLIAGTLVLGACASPARSPDVELASRIKQEIAKTEGVGSANSVKVETHQGVVILSGFINTEKQKEDAAQTALKVSGVQQVFNNLQVLNPGATASGR